LSLAPQPRPVTDYDAVVYDLDGTLVDLAVDWAAVNEAARALFGGTGVDPGENLFEMLDRAGEAGLDGQVEATIADHERAGAREATRGPLADELATLDAPAAVCSLNCEAACRTALSKHDLAAHAEVVVGRDSVASRKPDPEPLLAALEQLGVPPTRAVFAGDSERDETTARRAGVDFRWVDD
jgi:HAD superfamily hydrolase (TIGR01509 family)